MYFQCFSAVCLDLTIFFFIFAPVAHIQKVMANLSPSASEASKLLEAALQQMDGIIQGAKFDHVGPVQTSLNSSKGGIFINLKKYSYCSHPQKPNQITVPNFLTYSKVLNR